MRSQSGAIARRMLIGVLIVLVVAYVVLRAPTVVIEAGHRGVVFSRAQGVLPGSLGEGLHLIVPFIWDVIPYDVRSQTYTLGSQVTPAEIPGGEPLTALTADGQQVILALSVRFHLDPDNVWRLHQSIGQDYVAKIIKPQVRGDARIVAANYPGIDIYSNKRYHLQQALEQRLRTDLAPQYIVVEEVLVRNIQFSPQFQQAIEQKQIAQQDALRMDYVVKKQQQEKQQAIITARGEAEAIKLKGQALASYPELVQWEYVNNLPDGVKVIVSDTQTIVSLGDVLQQLKAAPAAPAAPGQR